MRRYDESVEVRRGLVGGVEGPAQFVWRGRLWVVRDVLGQWAQTGTWWERPAARALLGADGGWEPAPVPDLLGEEEVWRVEAGRGRAGSGVFDLSFDWGRGQWRLVGAHD